MEVLKVFVADDVNEEKLEPLKAAGIKVVKKIKLAPDVLSKELIDADGVIVRSATKISAELMDGARRLRVIGRAGVGVDNIDIRAATERGIVVMNAPDGNTITTAEHAVALLVSMARNIPQADSTLRGGKWDKKSFVGVELNGKTLGVIGLGRIGKHVVGIARGFGMKIVAFDPFVSDEQAKEMGITVGSLDDLFAQSDFITIHTPVTDETRGIFGREAFSKMKDGVRIVNCARGGLIDEAALVAAIESGKVAGAALDVYEIEPLPEDSKLLGNPKIITTPHLGASTTEAQEGVALTVAEQMRDFLLFGELRNAVNAPSLAAKELEALLPYIELAEDLGHLQAQVLDENAVSSVQIEYAGNLADKDASQATRSFVAGLLQNVSARVNVVNSMHIAEERGISITTSYKQEARASDVDISTNVSTRDGRSQTVSGKVYSDGQARITRIGDFSIEAVPEGTMLITKNRDVPGVIGKIGTLLGEKQINISRFYLGRNEKGGEALAVIEVDSEVSEDVINDLKQVEPVISVRLVKL
ncbi:MAG: phosphoglycerate dehydrogenase [Acidobacteria bacterium]|nr:MAG: phosphoglycerate dehydrogenase [Acidobacteriota bacterium]REK02114.1 MAG: phosphoglycerate dehydrogenase [Acidobacteriota bacterium]REK14084.1 MAG: phosphoglycerate dehydrogenase [Acidobacteriota bacterium]REK42079.1 MAG: phosphoglycerate dehydrogenase [Acidobacteriota bacterium]